MKQFKGNVVWRHSGNTKIVEGELKQMIATYTLSVVDVLYS